MNISHLVLHGIPLHSQGKLKSTWMILRRKSIDWSSGLDFKSCKERMSVFFLCYHSQGPVWYLACFKFLSLQNYVVERMLSKSMFMNVNYFFSEYTRQNIFINYHSAPFISLSDNSHTSLQSESLLLMAPVTYNSLYMFHLAVLLVSDFDCLLTLEACL